MVEAKPKSFYGKKKGQAWKPTIHYQPVNFDTVVPESPKPKLTAPDNAAHSAEMAKLKAEINLTRSRLEELSPKIVQVVDITGLEEEKKKLINAKSEIHKIRTSKEGKLKKLRKEIDSVFFKTFSPE